MQCLYVLYDERCGLCRWASRWAMNQPQLVDLVFIEAGSAEASRRFPTLTKRGQVEELIAVSDEGAVYRDSSAWIMCLYALEDYREWSLRLGSPVLRPLARQAFAIVSAQRGWISRWLSLSDAEVAIDLSRNQVPRCSPGTANRAATAGLQTPQRRAGEGSVEGAEPTWVIGCETEV
jgi:predicted DCC family thiol-disulfide oxidoreductase YuxK